MYTVVRNNLCTNKYEISKNAFESDDILNSVIQEDCVTALTKIKESFFDLIIIDPPYNIYKKFNSLSFRKMENNKYYDYIEKVVKECFRVLCKQGSLYICSEWNSSPLVHMVLTKYFIVQNRITWKRDKGRAAKKNWKNNSEDIYYVTKTNDYYFSPIKIKKKVIAPYRNKNNSNRDWYVENGVKYRDTACSNLIDNVTVPFWSMKENTSHPTQKPEKLMAKLVLASSKENDNVLDLFSGSGTTSVVCKKLRRNFVAIEKDKDYCDIIKERLKNVDDRIQGYENNIFLERNPQHVL